MLRCFSILMPKASLFSIPVTLGRLVIRAASIAWLVGLGALTFLPYHAFAQGVPNAPQSVGLPSFDRVRILTTPRTIQDAELTDQNDMPFLLSSLRGRVVLVLFGFTHCDEVCPLGMAQMRLLQESRRVDPEKIAYVLISVDGDRDTPVVMRKFLHKYSSDFIGLTGDPATVKPIAANFSASFFKENVGEHDGHYSVSHSPQIFMLDPAGHIRAEMYSASVDAMSGVALALLQEAKE